ncbi:MAG: NAD(P)/FAD-dependent oxidoreductase [Planctomycetota bacterium]
MSRSLHRRLHRAVAGPVQVSRRDVLAGAAAFAGSMLLSCSGVPRGRRPERRIVVIGAGFGGLACAHELQAAGYGVTVVEATNRVGGRVRSSTKFVPGRVVEFGAELIGSNHPTWMSYAKAFGLEMLELTENEDFEAPILLDGVRLSRDAAKRLHTEMEEVFDAAIDPLAAAIDADAPWNTPRARELDLQNTADWLAGLACSEACRRALRIEFEANNGQAAQRQSLLGNLTQVKGHGGAKSYREDAEVYRCNGGNQQLATRLAEPLASNLLLELPVRAVDWSENRVVITCADGRRLECDDVVVAVPPSVWSKIAFRPGLPAELSPQMGCNTKWFAALKSRFWQQHELEQYALAEGAFDMTWEGTDAQSAAGDVVFVAFNGGPSAERTRQLSAAARDAAYLAELEVLYPGFGAQLAGNPFFMDWPAEPWTRASYSFPAPGQITVQGPLLRDGLGGRVHFAGEHTCYRFVGYMEGALYSGVQLALRLARRDGVASAR